MVTRLSVLGFESNFIDSFPFDLIVERGIKWQSEYWTGLAARWIKDGYEMTPNLKEIIDSIYQSKESFFTEVQRYKSFNYEYPKFNMDKYISFYESKITNFRKDKVVWA